METSTRVEATSLGENQDLNPSFNLVTSESLSTTGEVKASVNFNSEEFLRHETNLTKENEQTKLPDHQYLPNIQPSEPSNTIEKLTSGSHSEESTKESVNQLSDQSRGHSITSDFLNNETSKQNIATNVIKMEPAELNESSLNRSNSDIEPIDENVSTRASGDFEESRDINKSENEETKNNDLTLEGEEQCKIDSTEFKENEQSSVTSNDETPKDEWMDILGSGHLMKKVLVAGIPNSRPNKSDICLISYTGSLEDGTVVDKAENLKIHLNDNEVIQGIDFALSLMDKGEEAEIKIGPRFAFGSLGRKPDIPSGSTLLYNIKLLDVQEEAPINALSINDRISLGSQKKERGNWWYSRGEHSIAINCYRRALEYLDDTDLPDGHSEEDVSRLLEEALKTYNNLGASQMKINALDAALMSVNKVINAQPKNVKALFRKAKILKEKGELQESINTVRQALAHDPDNQAIQQELSSLLAAQRKANSKQRELYKKMMGNSANQEKEKEKKNSSKNNYSTLKWVTFISFAVAVIGSIAIKYKT